MVASLYNKEEEQKAIWVFLERQNESLKPVSLELLSKGRELADQMGWNLSGLLLGGHVAELVPDAFLYGADDVILFEHPLLELFTVDTYSYAVYQAIDVYKPSVCLFGATADGRDLAGRLAVRLRTGLNADCTDLRMAKDSGVLICEVSGFGGGILALIEMESHRPQMATVRPGVFLTSPVDTINPEQVIRFPVEIPDEIVRTSVIERVVGQGVDLTTAPVLVAGGRGMEDRFDLLEELARLLDGDYGATRPPVDDGYIERERQIGQTGVVCRPDVAITCGISGAFHFVVGIQDAGTIIAINSDPEAPIFEYADYCIVGDVNEIVPSLINALRKAEGNEEPGHRSPSITPVV